MRDAKASEIRRLHKKVAGADRRIAVMSLPGKVAEVDPDKRMLRLRIGKNSKGEDILGPWSRWQEATAGGMRIHSEPDMDEQMVLHSPSGTVGEASLAGPATYDRDHDAPSSSSEISVIDRGGRIEVGPDGVRVIGGRIVLEGEVHLGGEGGELVHRKGDVDSGGDAAEGSASRVFAV